MADRALACRLAEALAGQLAAIAPHGLHIATDGTAVVFDDGRTVARTDVAGLIGDDLAIAARAVLAAAQDEASRLLTEPWPAPTMPQANAVWHGRRLRCFYGDPRHPVVELPGFEA